MRSHALYPVLNVGRWHAGTDTQSGTVLLVFLVVHVFQFRFGKKDPISLPVTVEGEPAGEMQDVHTLMHATLADSKPMALAYCAATLALATHLWRGWTSLVNSLDLESDHVPNAIFIGRVLVGRATTSAAADASSLPVYVFCELFAVCVLHVDLCGVAVAATDCCCFFGVLPHGGAGALSRRRYTAGGDARIPGGHCRGGAAGTSRLRHSCGCGGRDDAWRERREEDALMANPAGDVWREPHSRCRDKCST